MSFAPKTPCADLERLMRALAHLPGLGPRSARRAALKIIEDSENLLSPLLEALRLAQENVRSCEQCGNLDTTPICGVCSDPSRDTDIVCVVESVADLWALERARVFGGRYHVLGGVLSPLDGIGPEELRIPALVARVQTHNIKEVILATNATVDGQATAHYIAKRFSKLGISVSRLARGVPLGGELDYLDEGTLAAAVQRRLSVF